MAADERDERGSEEARLARRSKGAVAEATGRLAAKMATGLGGALLRNRTVRKTIRRAQEEARGEGRGEGPPTAP
jgi:hypothetical protein